MINRQTSKNILSIIFSKIPLSILENLTRTNIIYPYYHIISDEEIFHVKHLYKYKTIREFKEDLDFLSTNYSPIGLPEILNHVKSGLPLPGNCFLLTFDDGFREMSDIVAPILLEKGIPATFFVNNAFIDNKQMCYLNKASLIVEHFRKSWSQSLEKKLSGVLNTNNIRFRDIESGVLSIKYHQKDVLDKLAGVMNMDFSEYLLINKTYLTARQIDKLIENGFTIGAHSIDHPLYSSLSLEDQVYQTLESVRCVREMFHLSYGVFAFPHNDNEVSREFFLRISNSGLIDLSFGTGGLIDDCIQNHLQRFSLEKPLDPAETILAFQYLRKLKRLVTLSSIMERN